LEEILFAQIVLKSCPRLAQTLPIFGQFSGLDGLRFP